MDSSFLWGLSSKTLFLLLSFMIHRTSETAVNTLFQVDNLCCIRLKVIHILVVDFVLLRDKKKF